MPALPLAPDLIGFARALLVAAGMEEDKAVAVAERQNTIVQDSAVTERTISPPVQLSAVDRVRLRSRSMSRTVASMASSSVP